MSSPTRMSRGAPDGGFTLIESLAALAVLAVAAGGLIGVAQAHIDAVDGLRARIAAQWVAQNRLAELQLGQPDAPDMLTTIMGRAFEVTTTTAKTADPDLAQVTIRVRRQGGRQADAVLYGFVDRGATTP
jgi:general secretion pathway protein I